MGLVKVQNSSGTTGVLRDLWPGGKAWNCQKKPSKSFLPVSSHPHPFPSLAVRHFHRLT